MDEKTMVNDVLNCIKEELIVYQNIITQVQELELRQTIQTLRNNYESFQYELLKIAQIKGYYNKDTQATAIDIQNVKSIVQQ